MSAAILTLSALLAAGDWELVERDGALEVWTREKPDSDYEEIRTRIELSASAEATWAVLDDVERYAEFMPRLVEASILEKPGATVLYQYQKVDPPVLSMRDCVMRVELVRSNGLYRRRFRVATHPLAPPVSDDVVRMQVVEGEWTIQPLENGGSALSYRVHAEPGGRIPGWLANYANTVAIPRLMRSIQSRLKDR